MQLLLSYPNKFVYYISTSIHITIDSLTDTSIPNLEPVQLLDFLRNFV